MELETTKLRSKENLQQAILAEKERLTQMQWDMEELRQKSFEMELKLKSSEVSSVHLSFFYINVFGQIQQLILWLYCITVYHSQGDKSGTGSSKDNTARGENMLPELEANKQQLVELQKQHRELEEKSKADIKVLVKEVKSLRRSQAEYKQKLSQSINEKAEAEVGYYFSITNVVIKSNLRTVTLDE